MDEYSEDISSHDTELGAARSREPPKRKAATKSTTTASKSKPATSKSTARGRRKVKEEDGIIEIDC